MKRKINEKYEESQITTIYIFGLNYISLKNSSKKVAYTFIPSNFIYAFSGYLKHSNDTPKLNIQIIYYIYTIIYTQIYKL